MKWKSTFYTYFSSQAFSLLGASMAQFAIVWWLTIQTGSATVLAMASLSALLPQALVSPYAGVIVDRCSRKHIIIIAELTKAIAALALVISFAFGLESLWFIYLMLMIRAIGNAFHTPAKTAVTQMLVPEQELLRISGFNQILMSASSIAGPILGIMILNFTSIMVVLFLCMSGSLLASGILLFLRIPEVEKSLEATKTSSLSDLNTAVREVRSIHGMVPLLVFSVFINLVATPMYTLFPLVTHDVFQGTGWHASFVQGALGAGMIIGGILLGTLLAKENKMKLFYVCTIVVGLSFTLIGFLNPNQFWIFTSLSIINGIAVAIVNGAMIALVQSIIAAKLMGRVMALIVMMSMIASPIGLSIVGPLSEVVGLLPIFLYGGLFYLFALLLLWIKIRGIEFEKNEVKESSVMKYEFTSIEDKIDEARDYRNNYYQVVK